MAQSLQLMSGREGEGGRREEGRAGDDGVAIVCTVLHCDAASSGSPTAPAEDDDAMDRFTNRQQSVLMHMYVTSGTAHNLDR